MNISIMISNLGLFSERASDSFSGKCRLILRVAIIAVFVLLLQVPPLSAQAVLFDFDNAPLYSSFPLTQTAGGITANFTATGQGYSIQNANVIGFTPPGFSGRIIYPSSIYLSDIRIRFDHALTDFSIMYSCQELGCDDAARMRVTAYRNGAFVGTNTTTATFPGTWPVDTLRCSFPQCFDSVIVHYDAPPPTCQDYGVIYMADNMVVTPLIINSVSEGTIAETFTLDQNYPNPFNSMTNVKFQIVNSGQIKLRVYDINGKEVATLVNEILKSGTYEMRFDGSQFASGVYFYTLFANGIILDTKKMVIVK